MPNLDGTLLGIEAIVAGVAVIVGAILLAYFLAIRKEMPIWNALLVTLNKCHRMRWDAQYRFSMAAIRCGEFLVKASDHWSFSLRSNMRLQNDAEAICPFAASIRYECEV